MGLSSTHDAIFSKGVEPQKHRGTEKKVIHRKGREGRKDRRAKFFCFYSSCFAEPSESIRIAYAYRLNL